MPNLNLRLALFASLVAFLPIAVCRANSVYLTGALSYGSDAFGNNTSNPGEYDTFYAPTTNNAGMSLGTLNQINGTSILLPVGTNTVSVNTQYGPTVGLGLYFSTTPTPTYAFSQAPDLVAVDLAGPGWIFPVFGAQVGTYGQFSGLASYAGNTSFPLGDKTVTVTDFSTETITFKVTENEFAAVPLPSPLGIGMLTFATLGGLKLVKRKTPSRVAGAPALETAEL